jgi:hypothetical protein
MKVKKSPEQGLLLLAEVLLFMDSQHEYVISIIEEYDGYLEFLSCSRGYDFEKMSRAKWAVAEILTTLAAHPDCAPLIVIEDFRDRMQKYTHLNNKAKRIFSVATLAINDIIDLLLESYCVEGEYQ